MSHEKPHIHHDQPMVGLTMNAPRKLSKGRDKAKSSDDQEPVKEDEAGPKDETPAGS